MFSTLNPKPQTTLNPGRIPSFSLRTDAILSPHSAFKVKVCSFQPSASHTSQAPITQAKRALHTTFLGFVVPPPLPLFSFFFSLFVVNGPAIPFVIGLMYCELHHSLFPPWEHGCTVGIDRDPPVWPSIQDDGRYQSASSLWIVVCGVGAVVKWSCGVIKRLGI